MITRLKVKILTLYRILQICSKISTWYWIHKKTDIQHLRDEMKTLTATTNAKVEGIDEDVSILKNEIGVMKSRNNVNNVWCSSRFKNDNNLVCTIFASILDMFDGSEIGR